MDARFEESSIGFVRHENKAQRKPIWLPVKFYETAELRLGSFNNSAAPIAGGFTAGATCWLPDSVQISSSFPGSVCQIRSAPPLLMGQRAIFRSVCREFVQREGNGLRGSGRQQNYGAAERDLFAAACAIGLKLFVNELGEVGALPA